MYRNLTIGQRPYIYIIYPYPFLGSEVCDIFVDKIESYVVIPVYCT